ncbi:lysine transporter LysE [Rhodococcus sp. 06-412-2C]|uniref:LysE family translocator n=1 Tax=unclassified Rhodococcus (in: high G+C Gram-positive bacteria) TaxID=192944 RepID=UPI000B9B406C|nr:MULTISPECIES: LysE family translocator [unclassified Rhodococcus (in: high G+C Gram-positive bacteria)]OZC87165.1 lysine transporter LysE [Rhodococcus sp. 06-412-2C]OZD00605.1 lysine transporter LysE [Rhodococcus sp. 06-412-2B]
MISAATAAAFALASIALIAVPGPSVLFTISRSLAYGRRGGLVNVLGNGLGQVPLVVAVAAGVGALVASSAVALTAIKFLGAGYLAYLGVQTIRHRNRASAAPDDKSAAVSKKRLLIQGFTVGVTNPKSIVFLVAILPQFVDPSRAHVPLQLGALGMIFIFVAISVDSIWALIAGGAREWFATSPKRMSRMDGVGGGIMIGLGAVLLFSGNKR